MFSYYPCNLILYMYVYICYDPLDFTYSGVVVMPLPSVFVFFTMCSPFPWYDTAHLANRSTQDEHS